VNALSPALRQDVPAYELKFLISRDVAQSIADWAAEAMCPDPHADPALSGKYAIQTLYLDTATADVANARPGYNTTKLRVRRYGVEDLIYLEAKTKRRDRVEKRRARIPEGDLAHLQSGIAPNGWEGRFFLDRALAKGLLPATVVSYRRLAFVAGSGARPARLTLDEALTAEPERAWRVPKGPVGQPIPVEGQVLELKFASAMPPLFRQAIRVFRLAPVRVSKYRSAWRCLAPGSQEEPCLKR
jgi:hypothetical protein